MADMSDPADLLEFAVVDITWLLVTARALHQDRSQPQSAGGRKIRRRLRKELGRAVRAYLGTLSRCGDNSFDARALNQCRSAAEREMPNAIVRQRDLQVMLEQEPDALNAFAPARHDLWRLSHIAIHLRRGARLLRDTELGKLVAGGRSPGRRLQRRVRRAMVEYVRSLMGEGAPGESPVMTARRAAIDRLDADWVAVAAELARKAGRVEPASQLLEQGVAKPLRDLAQDWGPRGVS